MTQTHRTDGPPPGPARDLLDLYRELRHVTPRTNGQIAMTTGLSRSYISEVLNGRKTPTPDTAAKIASALGNNPHLIRRAQILAETAGELHQQQRYANRGQQQVTEVDIAPSPQSMPPASKPDVTVGASQRTGLTDPYVRRARLAPILLCLFPLILASILGWPVLPKWIDLPGLVVLCCLPGIANEMVRDRGRRLEKKLFAQWGGIPTTRLLRWDGPTSQVRQAHVHARLQQVLGPTLVLPSDAEERSDPAAADDIYFAATAVLRVAVRRLEGTSGLVFRENCNYGFRRNALALRPYGIAAAVIPVVAAVLAATPLNSHFTGYEAAQDIFVCAVACAVLCIWIFMVTRNWVHQAAHLYAERLIESLSLDEIVRPR